MMYGTLLCIGDPTVTEIISQAGFDVLWIDTEHSPISGITLQNTLIAARAGGTPAWVRIPWNDPVLAKPVLDMGADGIIFPYIRTLEDAERAVAACEYPPRGVRGYGPMKAPVPALAKNEPETASYMPYSNSSPFILHTGTSRQTTTSFVQTLKYFTFSRIL